MKITDSHDYLMKHTAATAPALHFDGTQSLAQWQATAKAKLEELLCLPLENCDSEFAVTGEVDHGDYSEIQFEFQSEPGYFIPCNGTTTHKCRKGQQVSIFNITANNVTLDT